MVLGSTQGTAFEAGVRPASDSRSGEPQEPEQCSEPGAIWQRATPEEAGFDAGKLREAVAFAQAAGSGAVRIYRNGCLVAEDAVNPESRAVPTQSFSVAKSVTSMVFGRAWTQGLMSPSDPVGSLYPEADAAHGRLDMRNLATMTSGNEQTLSRDFNLAMPDRVRDALTVPLIHRPGEYYNYWQSGVSLLADSVTRASGRDFQDYAQAELLGPIGIPRERWSWVRDAEGHTAGYYGMFMRADDYARIGELLRRDGVWNGQRLLSREYVQDAVRPTEPYPCYADLIWRHAVAECNGAEQPFLGLPPDMWEFNGAGGQLVDVFPSQGIMTVRTGVDDATSQPTSGESRRKFHDMVLGALEEPVPTPHVPPGEDVEHRRYGGGTEDPFFTAGGVVQPELPPVGPARARATLIGERLTVVEGQLLVPISCPPRHLGPLTTCSGTLGSDATSETRDYQMLAGERLEMRLPLTAAARDAWRRGGRIDVLLRAVNRDATESGTVTNVRRIVIR
ncbi:serine hydrolase [Saccharopolyspora sp. ID03-671]|uniref:serine hydrolase domain-containing protein n=1 Tax=Saccharopolyspora sp. ID03-671 TaxID=3073066 RepID=UPI00325200FE